MSDDGETQITLFETVTASLTEPIPDIGHRRAVFYELEDTETGEQIKFLLSLDTFAEMAVSLLERCNQLGVTPVVEGALAHFTVKRTAV